LLVGCPKSWQICAETPFWTWIKLTVNRMVPYGISKGEESRVHCQMKNHGYSLLRWERCHSSCLEGMILNSICFIERLRSTDAHSHQVCPAVSTMRTLGCTQVCTPQRPSKIFGWTVLIHPPYSHELISSDYHLFGPFKSAVSTPLLRWWGPIKCCTPEVAERGEYHLPGGSTWSCSKVEEGNLKERFFHSCQVGTEVRKRCRSAHTWTWC